MATLTLKKKPPPAPTVKQPDAPFAYDPNNPTAHRDRFKHIRASLTPEQRKLYQALREWEARANKEHRKHQQAQLAAAKNQPPGEPTT